MATPITNQMLGEAAGAAQLGQTVPEPHGRVAPRQRRRSTSIAASWSGSIDYYRRSSDWMWHEVRGLHAVGAAWIEIESERIEV